MKSILIMLMLLFLGACHPLAMFKPNAIKKEISLNDDALANKKIQIAIDHAGIPFIRAHDLHDAVYGLGFMHARDRLFQLDLLRHAALGKTAELFGERGLEFDRKLRILTYRLDEQLKHLSDEENLLINIYVQGVNDGAKQRGRSAEHFLLGIDFEEFKKREVVAIARLQSWQLGSDLAAEITRLKIARADIPLETKTEILSAMDDRGSAIIKSPSRLASSHNLLLPSYLDISSAPSGKINGSSNDIVQSSGGASNAWAIHKTFTHDNVAYLMSDPHLHHNWPSNFYLATIKAENFQVTGASFVGLPGILIGASPHLAWGVTASCLNTQDSVLLSIAPNDPHSYIVDGEILPFVQWPQRYCVNKRGKCIDEKQDISIFGPVIDKGYDKWIGNKDRFAVQWTGFHVDKHNNPSSTFFKLAVAQDVKAGISAIKAMTLPGVNFVLADTSGNVGYAYAGLVPARDITQHPYLPLDGRRKESLWRSFLDSQFEPQVINPESGFIVTANQNIFSANATRDLAFGNQGAPPYRALRITERIESMLNKKPIIDFDELSLVQLDDTSTEAKELASLIGSICMEKFANADSNRQKFAKAVAAFDGRYSTDSTQALPYELLADQIVNMRLKSLLATNVSELVRHMYQLRYTIKNALLKGLRGQNTAIFISQGTNDSDVKGHVLAACEPAFQKLVNKAGKSEWTWRWGRHHYIKRQSPLGKAPFIGAMFRDKKREVAGVGNAPLAEWGLPVTAGANLRFRAKMTSPPEIYAVIDSGNSGTVGDKNGFDQAKLWHEGKSIRLENDWQTASINAKTRFMLERTP